MTQGIKWNRKYRDKSYNFANKIALVNSNLHSSAMGALCVFVYLVARLTLI